MTMRLHFSGREITDAFVWLGDFQMAGSRGWKFNSDNNALQRTMANGSWRRWPVSHFFFFSKPAIEVAKFSFFAKNQNILSCIKQPEQPFLKTREIGDSFPHEAFIPMPARLSSNNCTSLAATVMRQNPIFCATISAQRPLNPNSEIVSPAAPPPPPPIPRPLTP